MLFPWLDTFTLPESASLQQLASQLTEIHQIEAAEISSHLLLVEVLAFSWSSKQGSFQGPGLLAGAVKMAQQLQFATP